MINYYFKIYDLESSFKEEYEDEYKDVLKL